MIMKQNGRYVHKRQSSLFLWMILLLGIMLGNPAQAAFDSGSDGSDGPLILTEQGYFNFDPKNFTRPDGQQLDPDGDGVYHFTSITIAAGVYPMLRARYLGTKPVVWLASGDVQIDGRIYISGEHGHLGTEMPRAALGGAGGHEGGAGARQGIPAIPGSGPGGGRANAGGSYFAVGSNNTSGSSYGNPYLMPLLGGSGGGGGHNYTIYGGGGGGGGGGAILIASSGTVTLNGLIIAHGGYGGEEGHRYGSHGGGGSGGAVRIMANRFEGGADGYINVRGGGLRQINGDYIWNGGRVGSAGYIRIETYHSSFAGTYYDDKGGNIRFVSPGKVFPANNTSPELYVVRINGIAVPPTAVGSFNPPDLEITATEPVTVEMEAKFVPVGTEVNLTLRNETEGVKYYNSTPLSGTFEYSTATATVTVPHGYTRFSLKANF